MSERRPGRGRDPRSYTVVLGEAEVLRLEGRPGVLRSTAAPPEAGWTPPRHPFVDAAASDPATEHRLRELLLASGSLVGFLERLVGAGFDVMSGREAPHHSDPPPRRIFEGERPVGALWPGPGQFASFWWQPEGDDEVYAHALVTAYDARWADTLLGVVAATGSMAELEAALAGLDLRVA